MILPLPVPHGAPEDAVRFIDLSGYPDLFTELAQGFPEPVAAGRNMPRAAPGATKVLAVVAVGSFEASFVPGVADLDRLDPRFRLPTEVWSRLGAYAGFGFAVFKLEAGNKRVHPHGIHFPARRRGQVVLSYRACPRRRRTSRGGLRSRALLPAGQAHRERQNDEGCAGRELEEIRRAGVAVHAPGEQPGADRRRLALLSPSHRGSRAESRRLHRCLTSPKIREWAGRSLFFGSTAARRRMPSRRRAAGRAAGADGAPSLARHGAPQHTARRWAGSSRRPLERAQLLQIDGALGHLEAAGRRPGAHPT